MFDANSVRRWLRDGPLVYMHRITPVAKMKENSTERWHTIRKRLDNSRPFLVAIIQKDVEVLRIKPQQPEQKRDLPSMMNAVIGRVLHQFPHWHGPFLIPPNHEFHLANQILIPH